MQRARSGTALKFFLISGLAVAGVTSTSRAYADTWTTGTSGQITSGASTKLGVGGTPAAQLDVVSNTASREAVIITQSQSSPAIARFKQGSTTRMLLTAPGNLGIGTTSPTEKLHVVGNVTVTGSVNADGGLKIKNAWSMEVPDYVFDETKYKPMALPEVEAFVKTNKHLPEIPSAAEMNANGMNIGEMNLLLLKKVEELTLYVIEQDKKIKELAAKEMANKARP